MKEGDVMLLQFRIKNFRSFANEVTLDMTAENSLTDHKDFLIEKNGVYILPVASIYGSNASGKSNLLDAFLAFRHNVIKSATMGEEDVFFATPFLFDGENAKIPTEFEAFFVIGDKEYRYGYTLFSNKIQEEWLYIRKLSKNNTVWKGIFERSENNTIVYNSAAKYGSLAEYNHLITDKMLVLSFFNDKPLKNVDEFSDAYTWIYQSLFTGPILLNQDSDFAWRIYYQDEELKNECVKFLQEFDPTIEDLCVVEDKDKNNNSTYRAYTVHNGQRYHIGIESQGTKKLIVLFVRIHLMLSRRGIMIIDELDCQLHPLILRRIIRMFHDKTINAANTQLIFSSHNLIVLDSSDLRRDEIWFTDKDERGISSLYSLASFRVDSKRIRSDLDFGRNYLAGKFGAIPYMHNSWETIANGYR